MIERKTSIIVCDDILFGLTGKVYLQGVYTSDITIPGDELIVPQLVFYFSAETSKENPFKRVTLMVTPPGMASTILEVPLDAIPQTNNPSRPKMILRAPLLVQQPLLRPGKIETLMMTEGGELDAGGVWITSVRPQPASI